jgi:hypothetical protein
MRQEVLDVLRPLDHEQELQWMIDLGALLTVSARVGYQHGETPGNVVHLMAFNEMQHRTYGRIRSLRRGEEWTLESFLNGLMETARHYHVEGDFGWALQSSMRCLK